ncbi:MAG: DUF4173 domain-containing protein [Oscillospiraceae bacterium]|nr:DUF4173 domain-containing protein [Oscillospiraceae bacterium]
MNENTRTSAEIAPGEIKFTQNQNKTEINLTKSDSLFTFLYIILGYAFVRLFIFYDWSSNFVFALPFYTAAYIFTVILYAKSKNITVPKESFFWIGVMTCIALTFRLENFFRLVLQILVAAYFTAVTGGLYGNGTSSYLAADLWNTLVAMPLGNFFRIFPAFIGIFKGRDKKINTQLKPVVYGGILAVCALWFIIPLLIRADSNFLSGTTDFMSHLFAGLFGDDSVIVIVNIIFAVPVACYLYGLSFSSMSGTNYIVMKKDELDSARNRLRISPALTLKVFLYIVCVVYILFIALQTEYLLGAFGGKLYGTMTYAQYARTGFFELCRVASINLSLLVLCNLLIVKEEYSGIKFPSGLLCILSIILLFTAMSKMIMYISAYGLTEKRIISTVFLVWLVTVFILCLFRLKKTFNITKYAVMTGAVMFCILFSFDIPVHCINYNEKYGYVPQITPVEIYQGDNSLYLPPAEDVIKISVSDSDGNIYNDIVHCREIMKLINSSYDTDMQSVQDYPSAEFYYTLNIHTEYGGIDTVYIYCYNKAEGFYVEQPYVTVCKNDFNWNSILAPYRN